MLLANIEMAIAALGPLLLFGIYGWKAYKSMQKEKEEKWQEEEEQARKDRPIMARKCLIKCLQCKRLFPSPIELPTAEMYLSSTLAGNRRQCPHCHEMTGCNKGNMHFDSGDGTIIDGDETIPE